MQQQDSGFDMDKKKIKVRKKTSGFIVLSAFPTFLVLLMLGTVIAGSVSYGIRVLSYRNKMEQAYSALEDDSSLWQENICQVPGKEENGVRHERVVTKRTIGPYILIVKEIRNKDTGQILINRQEFLPIGKADERGL